MTTIKKAAVIGSGVMGAGIAGHFANAGIPVLLLDIPQKGFGKKNSLAEGAIDRLKKSDPPALMHKKNAKLITAGNLDDDLKKLKDVDWVVEAIVEKKDIKQELYQKVEAHLPAHAVLSSNTSTIPLSELVENMSDDLQSRFMITHFFNPPRFMRLLEIVKGEKTSTDVLDRIKDFSDRSLGKGLVDCNDTPGFIANRIGTFWLQCALLEAIDRKITVEEADKLMGRPMGIPKTGVFGLLDLVGLDLMPLIGTSMKNSLPESDEYCQMFREPELLKNMIADGYTGRKGKGGFYRINKESGKKVKEVINLQTGEYSTPTEVRLGCLDVYRDSLQRFFNFKDYGAEYAWSVWSQVLCYAARLVPEIADDIYAVDTAMKLGYNWKFGPFELLDKIGAEWFAQKLQSEGRAVPEILQKVGAGSFYRIEDGQRQYFGVDGEYHDVPRRQGQLLLGDIKLNSKPILKNASAKLWDIGDGVVCFEFTSKQNSIDADILELLQKSIAVVEKDYKALVIHNEGSNFSVGANIGLALFAANVGVWSLIEQMVATGQKTYQALKYAPFPVVSAPSGMALGGGCEVLLHSDYVQAHAETYTGLVEVGVGLVPAWGGCKELLTRWMVESSRPAGAMVAVAKVFECIGTAKVAKSAAEAQEMLLFRPGQGITMNRDRLLFDAKSKALELAENYKPPQAQELALPGAVARTAMKMAVKGFVKSGKASPYDEEIAQKLSVILSGGETDIMDKVDEDRLLELEREAFMTLIHNPKTLARMGHILDTGKPLRN